MTTPGEHRFARPSLAGMRLGLMLLWLVAAGAHAQPVPAAEDLQQLAAEIRATGTPLVLVVWAHDCPYCRVLDEQILRPLQASNELVGRALLRRLDIDGGSVRDFAGRRIDTWEFAKRYRALLTPTVLFLDADGNELAERMVGINNVDFYPVYLDRAIAQATQNLHDGAVSRRP